MYRFGRAPLISGTGVQSAHQDPFQDLRDMVQKGRYEDALLQAQRTSKYSWS